MARDAGGRLGQIVSGDAVAEFESAPLRSKLAISLRNPVTTRYGLHNLRLDATAAGGVLPYERLAPHIREMLEKNAWAHAAKAFVADLIAAAEITGVNFGVPAE
jgi:peptidyl-prolyl cis-trans isomerase C